MFSMILEDGFEELDESSLLAINGGACTGGSSSGSSYSGGCTSCSSSGSGSSSTVYSGSCTATGIVASGSCTSTDSSSSTYLNQGTFALVYGDTFADQACAATSLLNELSEQYTAENGTSANVVQLYNALQSAVDNGSVDSTDAYVNNWANAANTIAESLGLKGSYTYTTDSTKADAIIYACDTDGDGTVNHFVNDIGNGKYYDPYTGKTGYNSNLTLASDSQGGTRFLDYSN